MMRSSLYFLIFIVWASTTTAQTNFSVPFDLCPDQGPTNMLSYELQQPGSVKLVVENVFTNLHVRTLLDEVQAAGNHQLAWDGYDDSGQPLETGIYVFKLSGDGWEVEEWSAIDCGYDAAIQSRIIVGGRDLSMGFANIIDESQPVELAVYSADGTQRVMGFSFATNSRMAFFYWAFEDSLGQVLPAGDYLYRMASTAYSEDIPFSIDPINRGSLSVTVTDGGGAVVTGISEAGDAPLIKGPLQQVEIGFGRPMSAAEIEYILNGGLQYYGAWEWARPSSLTVLPDSTGIIFSDFDLTRPWPDIWGEGSVAGYGLFDPYISRLKFGFDHEGFTRSDHYCHTIGELDMSDWVYNPGPFFLTPNGSMMPPCDNPIPLGQYAGIQYELEDSGQVVMFVIDSEGNRVRQLVFAQQSAGYKTVYWDGLDESGAELPKGLYHLIWDAHHDDGGGVITSGDIYVSNAVSAVPQVSVASKKPSLLPNFPNPFNPATVISFELPEATFARITILSLDGKKVTTLLASQMAAGQHDVTWNGRDKQGKRVPSGAYFYRLEAEATIETRRMLLLK